MNNKQTWIIGLFVVLLAAGIVWAVSTVPAPPAAQPEQPDNKIMKYTGGNTLSESQNGRKIWELTTESMDVNVETQDTECTNIQGKFYQENGDVVEIAAPHGVYEAKTKNLRLDGGVDGKTSKDATLKSEKLTWDAATNTLIAEGDAKITQGDMEASGDQLESSDGFTVFKASGHAHITKGKAKQ